MSALSDRELVLELIDRPDLLAIADAVAATQRRRRRLPRRLVAAPLAVAAAVALALVAPWQSGGPDFVDRAVAAVGHAPVIHAVVEHSSPRDAVVNLETGEARPRVRRVEYWYDDERKLLRTRLYTDGALLTEIVETPGRVYSDAGSEATGRRYEPQLEDPALAQFVTGYREALASGQIDVIGEFRVDGRPAKVVRLPARPGLEAEVVAIDAETYKPLRFHSVYMGGRRSPDFRVVSIESVARDETLFAPPKLTPPRGSSGSVSEGREITLAEAEEMLGAAPIWLGPDFAGERVESVLLQHARVELTNGGGAVEGVILRIRYGGGTSVSLASGRGGRYALGFDAHGGDPAPAPGYIEVLGDDLGNWQSKLEVGRFAVVLNASSRDRLLEAVRALRPIR